MDEVVIRGNKDWSRDVSGGPLGWAAAQAFLQKAGPMGQIFGVLFGIPGPGGGSNWSWLDPNSHDKQDRQRPTGEPRRTLEHLERVTSHSDEFPSPPVDEVYVLGSPPDRGSDEFWWLTPTKTIGSGPELQMEFEVPPIKNPNRPKPPIRPARASKVATQPEPSTENDEDLPTVYISGERPARDIPTVYNPSASQYRRSRYFSPFSSDVQPPEDLHDWQWDAQRLERRLPARDERSAYAETEWVFSTTKHSPIPMISRMDTGSSVLNLVLNKLLLPWRNLLATIENTPFEIVGAIDDAMYKSRFRTEWQAWQSMSPLLPAMGLAIQTTGTLTYLRGLFSSSTQEFANLSRIFAVGFVTTGGIGGYSKGHKAAKTMISVAPSEIRRSGNAYKGSLGVERTLFELLEKDPNYISLGRELAFEVRRLDNPSMEPVPVRFDELFVTPDGQLLNAESKFGRFARLTPNEAKAGYSQEMTLIGVPTNATALRTGLEPEQPVLIMTRMFRWNWDL